MTNNITNLNIKRTISLLLVFAMIFGFFPSLGISAQAASGEEVTANSTKDIVEGENGNTDVESVFEENDNTDTDADKSEATIIQELQDDIGEGENGNTDVESVFEKNDNTDTDADKSEAAIIQELQDDIGDVAKDEKALPSTDANDAEEGTDQNSIKTADAIHKATLDEGDGGTIVSIETTDPRVDALHIAKCDSTALKNTVSKLEEYELEDGETYDVILAFGMFVEADMPDDDTGKIVLKVDSNHLADVNMKDAKWFAVDKDGKARVISYELTTDDVGGFTFEYSVKEQESAFYMLLVKNESVEITAGEESSSLDGVEVDAASEETEAKNELPLDEPSDSDTSDVSQTKDTAEKAPFEDPNASTDDAEADENETNAKNAAGKDEEESSTDGDESSKEESAESDDTLSAEEVKEPEGNLLDLGEEGKDVTLEETITAEDGSTYQIAITYTADAALPSDADLLVSELTMPENLEYMDCAEELLEVESFTYARFFDITIVDSHGNVLTPSAPVQVSIVLLDVEGESEPYSVVHFGEEPEPLKAETDGNTVSFVANGFSVYAIVSGPEPILTPDTAIKTLGELSEAMDGCNFTLSVRRSGKENYFKKELNSNSAFLIDPEQDNANTWYFESANENENQYRIYTFEGGVKKYMVNTSGNLMGLTTDPGTVFELSESNPAGRFYFKVAGQNKWLQYSQSGNGMRLYNANTNAANCLIAIVRKEIPQYPDDVYGLDGKSYGIMLQQNTQGTAMMAEVINKDDKDYLKGQTMLVRSDPVDRSNLLYVSQTSDMSLWTFHSVSQDQYTLSTVIDGSDKYIRIEGEAISLVDTPDAKCVFQVIPGTGAKTGMFRLLGEDNALDMRYSGFTAMNTPSASSEWLNLAAISDTYTDEDFIAYSAAKVSISDTEKVHNGSKIILYTRVWNDNTKNYEFYVVDHNGYLARAYESGDSIVWIGSVINTMPYIFTEYYYEGTTTPNYYYDLQNEYSGEYLTPRIAENQIMSDEPIGLNLNGRREGEFYSTILAWDDPYYDYAGLKTSNGRVISAPMSQAETFYVAVMNEDPVPLTQIDTVDHEAHGITMRMVDFNGNNGQNEFLGNTQFTGFSSSPGMLSKQLGEDGYPTNTNGVSLGTLYEGSTPANHLFLESTFYDSGYFEFDSTQNFAAYDSETQRFKVYQELGTIDIPHNSNTIQHGQFMPYNDLYPGDFCRINQENLYDAQGKELTDNDPRKGEPLYRIPSPDSSSPNAANYYFGAELSGNFVQPPSGLDAWGHDIIFEFTGDDDFWLYVDGELILDLGGIHSAIPGSINYRTGKVIYRDASKKNVETTLYDIFKTHYEERNPEKTAAEVQEYLDSVFCEKVINGTVCRVFKDYTAHDIRIFFMERGAGASNLKMRFNLTSVVPGKVLLSKEISGTDKLDYASAVFPFQIFYDQNDGYGCTNQVGQTQLDIPREDGGVSVTYQTTSANVPFRQTYTVGSHTYSNVFLLKPGEIAEIMMPDNTIGYKVIECGVKNDIYDYALVNGQPAQSTTVKGDVTDYESSIEAIRDRAQIIFSNHVDPDSLRTLTITKRLFDANGNELTEEDDPTKFKMRVYLGEDLDYYRFGEYSIKSPSGEYCFYNAASRSFSSTGVTAFNDLTDEQKATVVFRSSLNGAIDNIPAGYSIEIRNLLVGTRFMVSEQVNDIPIGYGLRHWTEQNTEYNGYKRVEGSYIVTAGEPQNSGIIRDNNDPHIEVHNQRGWGISAKKIWSDADFMASHDDVFFAVYVKGELLQGSVRRIGAKNYTSYYFPELQQGAVLDDYEIREVELTNPVVATDESVTFSEIRPKAAGDSLTIGGTPNNASYETGLNYTVSYQKGIPYDSAEGLANIRSDTVRNTRLGGLKIIKTDLQGNRLANAVFELKQGAELIGKYTSNTDGLVTNAYLEDGIYTLTEVKSPAQHKGMEDPITIAVESGTVTVTVNEEPFDGYDSVTNTLTVKNKPFILQVVKIDSKTRAPLQYAHFALYKQVKGATGLTKDYVPVQGYADLVSDENGIVQGVDQTLKPGTYYLTETEAPDGYELPQDICDVLLTVSATGEVSIDRQYAGELTISGEDEITYTITVANEKELIPVIVPTGINLTAVSGMALILSAVAALAFIFIRKRKEGSEA